jgi:hypothetical protein
VKKKDRKMDDLLDQMLTGAVKAAVAEHGKKAADADVDVTGGSSSSVSRSSMFVMF